jgi:hypothetical protein
VEEGRGDAVVWDVDEERANDSDIVDDFTEFGEGVEVDFDAGFTGFGELEGRAEGDASATAGDGLTVVFFEGGFGIPGVDVGGCTGGEEVNDGLGLGGEVRVFGGERVEGSAGGASVESVHAKESAEAECAEAETVLGQEVAA